jgi:hypothetical protein
MSGGPEFGAVLQGCNKLAMNVVDDLERRIGITTRWTMESLEYKEGAQFITNRQWMRTVERLEGLVVQRLFELAKANLSATGYKLHKHIAKAILRRSTAIKNALDCYNRLAPLQHPPHPQLKHSELAAYAMLGEFDLLRPLVT